MKNDMRDRDIVRRTHERKLTKHTTCSGISQLIVAGEKQTCCIRDLSPFGAGLYLARVLPRDTNVCLGYIEKDEELLVVAKVVWQKSDKETIQGIVESHYYRVGLKFQTNKAGIKLFLKVEKEVMMAAENY